MEKISEIMKVMRNYQNTSSVDNCKIIVLSEHEQEILTNEQEVSTRHQEDQVINHITPTTDHQEVFGIRAEAVVVVEVVELVGQLLVF